MGMYEVSHKRVRPGQKIPIWTIRICSAVRSLRKECSGSVYINLVQKISVLPLTNPISEVSPTLTRLALTRLLPC